VWRLSATAPGVRRGARRGRRRPDDRIEDFPVTKGPNGKEGEGVDEYEIELIPTVVVETADGEEVARFVEEADVSIAEYLAGELAGIEVNA